MRRVLGAAWQALPRSKLRRLLGDQNHLALELVGTGEGITYYIGIRSSLLLRVLQDQLAVHFPGATLEPASDYLPAELPSATSELVSAQPYDHAFLIPRAAEVDPFAGILASLRGTEAGRLAA